MNALATFTLRWLIPRLSGFQVANPADRGAADDLERAPGPPRGPVRCRDPRRAGQPSRATVAEPFLSERRIPVCSPALLRRLPLHRHRRICAQHTLLHAATLPRVWPHWLRAAGVPDLTPQATVTLEHFYLTLQAALDGLGVAMGPSG